MYLRYLYINIFPCSSSQNQCFHKTIGDDISQNCLRQVGRWLPWSSQRNRSGVSCQEEKGMQPPDGFPEDQNAMSLGNRLKRGQSGGVGEPEGEVKTFQWDGNHFYGWDQSFGNHGSGTWQFWRLNSSSRAQTPPHDITNCTSTLVQIPTFCTAAKVILPLHFEAWRRPHV